MYTVYVLKGKDNIFYKGVTSNMSRRLSEHISGGTKSTKNMEEIKIVYIELFDTFPEARKREVYFKTAAGRRFLKTKIK